MTPVRTLVAIATNAGKGPNAAGFFFDCRIRMPDGKEITLASDATWEWTIKIPAGKEGRLGAFDAKDWKPATVVKALPVWQKVIDSQAPALLAQGAHASTRRVRASLVKSDFLMRTLGRPNRDQIVSTRPHDGTAYTQGLQLLNGRLFESTGQYGGSTVRELEPASGQWAGPVGVTHGREGGWQPTPSNR